MKQRILTGLVLAPLAVAAILLSSAWFFALLVSVIWLLTMWEWTRLIGLQPVIARILFLVVGGLLMAGLWTQQDSWIWWLSIGLGLSWWLLSLLWMRHFSFAASPTPRSVQIKLVAGLLVLVPAWVAAVELHGQADAGPAWTLFALVLVWAADSFAYFVGSRYGRTKLAPRISPGKTREGVWGAMLGTGIVALIGGWWLGERGLPLVLLIALALVCVTYSVIGDLFESLMKRQANVKDSGALFPGHGGLLDRLDGVFAALPMFVAGKTLIDLLFPA